MKKKLLAFALISVLAISALGLAACGTEFSETYKNPYKEKSYAALVENTKVLTAQKDLDLDFAYNGVEGNLGLFGKADPDTGLITTKIYNFETDSVVATFTNTQTTTGDVTVSVTYTVHFETVFVNDEFHDYFWVQKTTNTVDTDKGTNVDEFEYTLYNADGTSFATCTENAPYKIFDTVFADNDYYRLNKAGKFEKAGTRAKNAAKLPDFGEFIDGKYYAFDGKKLFVYDSSFSLINFYEIPSYAMFNQFFVLNDGNVLVQYMYTVSDFDTDYTIYDSNTNKNYKVITQIYDIKKGEAKDIETVVFFYAVIARNSASEEALEIKSSLSDSIVNVGMASYITNKRIDGNAKNVSIKNDGTIDKVLFESILAQQGFAQPLANGNFIVRTKTGAEYLVDAKGNIIADVTDAMYEHQKYIVVNSKIYDQNFKELASYDEEKWNIFRVMNNSLVFECIDETDENAENKFRLFAEDKFTDITLTDNQEIADYNERYYVIATENTDTGAVTYSYYNENGVKLFDSALLFNYNSTARNGKALLTAYDGDNDKLVNFVLYTAAETK